MFVYQNQVRFLEKSDSKSYQYKSKDKYLNIIRNLKNQF